MEIMNNVTLLEIKHVTRLKLIQLQNEV